jgi:hypothetical protein
LLFIRLLDFLPLHLRVFLILLASSLTYLTLNILVCPKASPWVPFSSIFTPSRGSLSHFYGF